MVCQRGWLVLRLPAVPRQAIGRPGGPVASWKPLGSELLNVRYSLQAATFSRVLFLRRPSSYKGATSPKGPLPQRASACYVHTSTRGPFLLPISAIRFCVTRGYVMSLHLKAFDELQGLLRRDMAVAKMVAAAIVKLPPPGYGRCGPQAEKTKGNR